MITDIITTIMCQCDISAVHKIAIACRDKDIYAKLVYIYDSNITSKNLYGYLLYTTNMFIKTYLSTKGFHMLSMMQIPMLNMVSCPSFADNDIKLAMTYMLTMEFPTSLERHVFPLNERSESERLAMIASISHSGCYYVIRFAEEYCIIYTHLPICHENEKVIICNFTKQLENNSQLVADRYA